MERKKSKRCLNESDNFCYICGKFTPRDQRKSLSCEVKIAYYHYFGVKVTDQERTWAPHVCCSVCYVGLTQWLNGKRKKMPLSIPIWREPKDHHSDCYFCMTNIIGYSKKTKASIAYPNCASAMKPVPHSVEYPIPTRPTDITLDSEEEEQSGDEKNDVVYEPDEDKNKPQMITQSELSDLVRDLGLTKRNAELLGSRLQQWNLLDKGTKIYAGRLQS